MADGRSNSNKGSEDTSERTGVVEEVPGQDVS